MATFRYKNVSLNTVVIPNQGAVAPGDVISLPIQVTSPDLETIQDIAEQAKPPVQNVKADN